MAASPDNTIGGIAAADRNVISGNGSSGSGFGIYVSRVATGSDGGARTLIQGNFIGTDKSGTVAVPNHYHGVLISIGANTTVGGTALAARNLISGNLASGIAANDHGALIQGNLIGTDITGTVALANGTRGSTRPTESITRSAGRPPEPATLFRAITSASTSATARPERVVQGNVIGTDATATINLGNRVAGILAKTTSATIGGTAAGAGNVIAFSYAGNGTGIEYFSSGRPRPAQLDLRELGRRHPLQPRARSRS